MASHKITKVAGAQATNEFELSVAQALVDLENNVAELKKDLRPLQITAAKEVSCCCYRGNIGLVWTNRHVLYRLKLVVARRLLSSLSLFPLKRHGTRSKLVLLANLKRSSLIVKLSLLLNVVFFLSQAVVPTLSNLVPDLAL